MPPAQGPHQELYPDRLPKRARLRVRRRRVHWYAVLPVARYLAVTTLIVSLTIGGLRYLGRPNEAGALEFTQHTIGAAEGIQGVAAGDTDGDGDDDIVTAGTDGIKVFENSGSFSFTRHFIDDKRAERVQLIDLNEDGSLDILATFGTTSPSVRWYEHIEAFGYQAHDLVTAGRNGVAYAGDINGNGDTDIVTISEDAGEAQVLERWMNNGSGSFSATTIDGDSKATALSIGDLNGNGYNDIVIGGENGLQRWDTGDGLTWSRVDVDDGNANRTHLDQAITGNGTHWIATADSNVDEVALYRSGPSGSTEGTYGRLPIDDDVDAKTVDIVDLDGDGDLDLLVAAQDNNAVYWYENDGSDMFSKRTIATGLQSVYGVVAVDLDNDGDGDVVTGDHMRNNVYAYERTRTKPTATSPTEITQSTAGGGIVSFKTVLADGDRDPTRIRVQYSTDGTHWYKPWLTKVVAGTGSVDLKNSNGYQIGTSNPIDTNAADNVELTLTWDTKSVENTGGPISGDVGTVRLRVIPRDDKSVGETTTSGTFRIDNDPPQGLANLTVIATDETQAILSWAAPTDSNTFEYKLYYGTDHAAVLEQRSEVWDSDDDATMADIESTTTTVTGLTTGERYTFKLFVTDAFGNTAAAPSTRGTAVTISGTPLPSPTASTMPLTTPLTTPSPLPSAAPTTTPSPTAAFTPVPSPSPSPLPSPTPTPSPPPSVLEDNQPPVADAGPDQVVNPLALVILDGTASFDPDPGDTSTLTYSWRQLSGPDVDVASDRTATASFSAGGANETYIFAFTVRDLNGASAIDTVTVATRELPPTVETGIEVETTPPDAGDLAIGDTTPFVVAVILQPIDLLLFILSLFSTVILLIERATSAVRDSGRGTTAAGATAKAAQSKVVHYKTGDPIAGAQVLIYSGDGKLRTTERTNNQGVFGAFFPPGNYTLGVRMDGFSFAPAASRTIAGPDAIIYSGGTIQVKDSSRPPAIIIPMKPTAAEVAPLRIQFLHAWQRIQRIGRLLSWPIFLAGALLNTVLVFFAPSILFLVLEVLYIILVVTKIALEVRVRPAYGQVRDAITHIPLDLAVVRLFDQETKRLIMTRVTNNQGKFFALPPAGKYMVTVSKAGYGTFTKENVDITSERDTTLQMTADLMPIAPPSSRGLQQARAATL